MHHQAHRHNGISILWLCTTNHTDTMELQVSGYAQLTTQIQWNFKPSGYAPLTTQIQRNFTPWLCTTNPTDTMELQLSRYALLTAQMQWNFYSLVMHN